MMFFDQVLPVLVGAGAGILYGCFFVLQQKTIFRSQTSTPQHVQQIGFFIARLLILICAGHYLLRSAMIPSILGSIAFFSIFWLIILIVRTYNYERI